MGTDAGRSAPTPMRFGVESTDEMSEAVRRVLSLDNASNKELVQVKISRAIEAFQERNGDTGSTPVQVAVLTVKINALKGHMQLHRKDFATKRSLEALVQRRR